MFKSRFLEHSRNKKTDILYTPLRQALIESQYCKQHNTRNTRCSSLRNLGGSSVSKFKYQLNPFQAQNIAKKIIIPDANLIPTQNINKVQNKTYLAIKINTKQHPVIDQQQFNRRQTKNNTIQKIVYQIQKQQNNIGGNEPPIKNMKESSIYQFTTIKKSVNMINESVNVDFAGNNSKQVLYSFGAVDINNKSVNMTNESVNEYFVSKNSKQVLYSFGAVDINKKLIQKNNKTNQNQYGLNPKRQTQITSTSHKTIQFSSSQKTLIKPNSFQFSLSRSSSSNKKQYLSIINKEQVQNLSKFTIVQQKIKPESKLNLTKTTAKYNFFSALDPIVNSKFQQFGNNQIIASKPMQAWAI